MCELHFEVNLDGLHPFNHRELLDCNGHVSHFGDSISWLRAFPHQCSGRFLGITGWDPSVCLSNWLHVDILRFSFIKLGNILWLPLKWSVIFLKVWTSAGCFSNSTGSSVTNCRFSPIIAPHTRPLVALSREIESPKWLTDRTTGDHYNYIIATARHSTPLHGRPVSQSKWSSYDYFTSTSSLLLLLSYHFLGVSHCVRRSNVFWVWKSNTPSVCLPSVSTLEPGTHWKSEFSTNMRPFVVCAGTPHATFKETHITAQNCDDHVIIITTFYYCGGRGCGCGCCCCCCCFSIHTIRGAYRNGRGFVALK